MSQAEPRYSAVLALPLPSLIAVHSTDDSWEPGSGLGTDRRGSSREEHVATLTGTAYIVSQPASSPAPYDTGPQGKAYRFRCGGRHRQHRRIEIEGHQTLGHLDVALRQAFRLPLAGGISRFELVADPRERVRSSALDLAVIDPYDGEGGSDRTIADLKLEPGACLRYRCELSTCVEREIALEAVDVSNPRVCYPRIIDRTPAN